MPWTSDPAKRRRDQAVYGTDYRRARDQARRRASGRCEHCQHPHGRLECDHIIPVTQGGTHALANLRMLCKGPGTCRCHERKTATEGGGYRQSHAAADPAPAVRGWWT